MTLPESPFNHDPDDGRLLAIDYGDKRVGLAVSDPMGWFAVGIPTLNRNGGGPFVADVATSVSQYRLKGIVVGMPYHMDGSESEKSSQVRAWLRNELVPAVGDIPVGYVDERLSSSEAEDRLREQGKQPSRDKGSVDQMAACLMVEQALNRPQSITWLPKPE